MLVATIAILFAIFNEAICLQCLTNESKKAIDDSKKALKALDTYLGQMVNALGTLKNNVGKKFQTMEVLADDCRNRKWKKYNGHCYRFVQNLVDWFTAEKRCKEFGGYIAKINDKSENTWITANRPKGARYWIGLTKLKDRNWRWSLDQSRAKYTEWYFNRGGYRNASYKCTAIIHTGTYWYEEPCSYTEYYVCERNRCL